MPASFICYSGDPDAVGKNAKIGRNCPLMPYIAIGEQSVQSRGVRRNEPTGMIHIRRARVSDYPEIEIFIREAYGELAHYKDGNDGTGSL
jgi:hypothetical protein